MIEMERVFENRLSDLQDELKNQEKEFQGRERSLKADVKSVE
jgi:hypothetical protein